MLSDGVHIESPSGGRIGAYLGKPIAPTAPIVVVAQEIFGITPFIRTTVEWLVGEGYGCVCPDLYWKQAPNTELDANVPSEREYALKLFREFDMEAGVADLVKTVEYARGLPFSNGRVAVVGYCLGGRLAFEAAARSLVDCAVGYYGIGLEERVAQIAAINKPAMFHMGTRDHYITADARAVLDEECGRNRNIELHWYPAGHSFVRSSSPFFDHAAAELANGRTLELLASLKAST
jgi:carboxymethylenebutenolidase